MSPHLEQQIFDHWPNYFRHRADFKRSAMMWGFACHDGWFQIIWDLFVAIESEIGLDPPTFEVEQVKQKFGGLRVYADNAPDKVEALIEAAAQKSYETCEQCGSPGTIRQDRQWWMVLCDPCADQDSQ